jgi:hypothetical protein
MHQNVWDGVVLVRPVSVHAERRRARAAAVADRAQFQRWLKGAVGDRRRLAREVEPAEIAPRRSVRAGLSSTQERVWARDRSPLPVRTR